jgi:hypothetical protein
MRFYLYVFLLLFISTSCILESSDLGGYHKREDTELGQNIILSHSDTSLYHIFKDSSKSLQKGSFVKYHQKHQIDTLFIEKGSIVIESHINKVNYNKQFIIIDQKPLDSIFGEITNKEFSPHRKNKPDDYREALNKLNKSKIHKYWIINKRTDDIYGPYSKKVYLQKRKELNISEKLKFQ